MSVHTGRSMEIARSKGALAGEPEAAPLWELSKREILEVALRLSRAEDAAPAVQAFRDELDALQLNGIV